MISAVIASVDASQNYCLGSLTSETFLAILPLYIKPDSSVTTLESASFEKNKTRVSRDICTNHWYKTYWSVLRHTKPVYNNQFEVATDNSCHKNHTIRITHPFSAAFLVRNATPSLEVPADTATKRARKTKTDRKEIMLLVLLL